MAVKIALPKGRLLRKTSARLQKAEWRLDEYHSKIGFYRPKSERFPDLLIRVFHEKDIPIQIALGNYDMGICCLDWIEELLVKYPSSDIVKVKDLLYGEGKLYMAAPVAGEGVNGGVTRIASEYPNLAEAYALRERLSRFSVFPVWGAAEAYPPESAELALLAVKSKEELAGCDMMPVRKVLDFSAFLIANRHSWETKGLDKIVTSICETVAGTEKKAPFEETQVPVKTARKSRVRAADKDTVRLALPDGHQQQPMVTLLNSAGIELDDYPSETGNRRPRINMDGVSVKVVRPQDTPLQVANGNFDLAVTGRDWLTDHLSQFPSSPVKEVLDLNMSRVRLVAVVHEDFGIEDTAGLRRLISEREKPLRVASEYVNLADRYARDNRLGHYHVVPTWGASEAFLPEDADLLIENTETGRTIARHNLTIIDTLFHSSARLIANVDSLADPVKGKRMTAIIDKLRSAVKEG